MDVSFTIGADQKQENVEEKRPNGGIQQMLPIEPHSFINLLVCSHVHYPSGPIFIYLSFSFHVEWLRSGDASGQKKKKISIYYPRG